MHTVMVRLRKPTRVFSFSCGELALKRDDRIIVRTDRGLEYGVCLQEPVPCLEDGGSNGKLTVVRKAHDKDQADLEAVAELEAKAHEVCARQIEAHRLPMRLVDVEYTFDRRKVVFYFTAEERVDFRELVRDLAHELKARIELRHIQVRDEAKLVGGLGTCGRELCCASWLREFMPISMKMAKRQNLSLNPANISGQCGRLMCCIRYEYDQYPDRKKKSAQSGGGSCPAKDTCGKTCPAKAGADEAAESGAAKTESAVPAASETQGAAKETGQSAGAEGAPKRKRRRRRRRKKKPGNGSGGSGAPQS